MSVIRRVVVRGRVHGVGFRAFVEDEARRRRLEGFVRNRRDGSVEALFAGSAEAVEDMIAACRRGPESASVAALDVVEAGDDDLNLRRPGERFSVLASV